MQKKLLSIFIANHVSVSVQPKKNKTKKGCFLFFAKLCSPIFRVRGLYRLNLSFFIVCCVILHPWYTAMLCGLSDIFMSHDVVPLMYAKPVYYGNDICSTLFICSQRQTFALHTKLAAGSSSDAEREKMLTPPKSLYLRSISQN